VLPRHERPPGARGLSERLRAASYSPAVVVQLAGVVPVEGGGRQRLQLVLELLVLLLEVDDDRVQEVDLYTAEQNSRCRRCRRRKSIRRGE